MSDLCEGWIKAIFPLKFIAHVLALISDLFFPFPFSSLFWSILRCNEFGVVWLHGYVLGHWRWSLPNSLSRSLVNTQIHLLEQNWEKKTNFVWWILRYVELWVVPGVGVLRISCQHPKEPCAKFEINRIWFEAVLIFRSNFPRCSL